MPTAALVSLATSVPPHVFLQKDVLAAAWDVFGRRFPNSKGSRVFFRIPESSSVMV